MPKTKKELYPEERALLKGWLKNYTKFYQHNYILDNVIKRILTQEEFRKAETIFRKSLSLQETL